MIRFPSRSKHPPCPAGWEITRALSQPETGADVVRHMRECPACARLATELCAVISTAAELPPVAPMAQAARDRISRALSAASEQTAVPPVRRRRVQFGWALAAGLAGFALVLGGWFLAARRSDEPPVARRPGAFTENGKLVSLAKVRAFGGAVFHRLSEPPDETVRLESGRVSFAVAHLTSEQRFRVLTHDGEVEVRGTRFEAEARGDVLWAVSVSEGIVDVRVGDAVLRLQAGDEWQRQQPSPAATMSAAVEPPDEPEPSVGLPGGHAKVQQQRTKSGSFDLAWSHLRRGEWDAAARGFAAVAVQSRGQALEEDALYWQAVATARAGQTHEASRRFEALLDRFPAGARAKVATLALAWLYLDAGERDRARPLFERAAQDASATVREGAEEGLRRLRTH